MNDDLLKNSLTQGKLFNSYQTKIKKGIIQPTKYTNKRKKNKEGFVSSDQEQIVRPNYDGYIPVLQREQQITKLNNQVNQKDLDELVQLQTKYNDLLQQYTNIQTKISDSSLDTIGRLGSNNPYRNKYLLFTDGTVVYVTNQGIVRPITSDDILNSIAGKNGCPPKDFIKLNISWSSQYILGTTIPTVPPLIVGDIMTANQSCGNEGSNVYASRLVNNPTSSYVGCYNDKSGNTTTDNTSAMIFNPDTIGYTTFDKCQEYASDNGYTYFGLQDVQTDGTSACLVSNDIERTQIYGDASKKINEIPIWSSNTTGSVATSCYINSDGRVLVNDSAGNILWQSPNSPSDCSWSGYVNPDSIQGSWGGNCVGKPLNVDCGKPDPNQSYGTSGIVGNLNTILKNQATTSLNGWQNPQANWSFNPMSKWSGKDPARCCAKMVDYSYQCGGGSFKTGQVSGGSNINFDCSNEVKNCTFFLMLQSDGNLCLYRGSDPSNNNGEIWCTMTNGKQQSPNVDWAASKGKFGRSYLKINESLSSGEWIGSDDGSLKLIMQPDGNLVLYTSNITSGCKVIGDKTYGGPFINAVYKMNETGDRSTLGKIGYIDSESDLREYPDSMVGFINDYQIYQNTDSIGNNITTLPVSDENQCKVSCNNNPDCAAYVYQGSSQTCWLKNKESYPKGDKQPYNGTILGVRQPGLKGSSTCSSKIVNIDTIQYNNYVKGTAMSPDTKCNISVISQEDKIKYDNIKSQLITIGNDITSKMEALYNQDKTIFQKLNTNAEQFKKDLENYKLTNLKIKKEFTSLQNLQSNNIEGMQNFTTSLNINDINGMLSDSDLRVLQGNYSYLMWSILAVGLLTVTINTMKK